MKIADIMRNFLLSKLGGNEGVHNAVDLFYEKILQDETLAPFFEGMNIDDIKMHQRAFFLAVLGGVTEYSGRTLRDAHKELVADKGLNNTHFDSAAKHLEETFIELGVDEHTTSGFIRIIESLRDEVLDR